MQQRNLRKIKERNEKEKLSFQQQSTGGTQQQKKYLYKSRVVNQNEKKIKIVGILHIVSDITPKKYSSMRKEMANRSSDGINSIINQQNDSMGE